MAYLRGSQLTNLFSGTEVTYNGYTLPPEGLHVYASSRPVMDPTGKTKLYDHITFTADFVVVPESLNERSTDTLVAYLRRVLTKPNQQLTIKGHGLGDIRIRSNVSDVNNGPVTTGFDWEQLQSNRVAHIIWTVEFNLPGCSSIGFLTSGNITSFNYSVKWGWDDISGGLRKRTITGSVGMFAFSQGDFYFSTTREAETLLEQHFPRPNAGYHRNYDFDLSDDRKTLLFTISESEIMSDVPYPEPIMDLHISQELEGGRDRGFFTQWSWSINSSVQVFKPRTGSSIAHNKVLAWVALTRIILDRLLNYKDKFYYAGESERPVTLFIDNLRIADDITGNGFEFSIRGAIYVNTSNLFQATGMFQPMGGNSNTWQQRNQFITNQNIDAFQLPSDLPGTLSQGREKIINICTQARESATTYSAEYKPKPPQALLIEDDKPTAESSWRGYEYRVRLIDYNQSVVNVPLSAQFPRIETARKSAERTEEASPVSDFNPITYQNALTEIVTVHNPTAKVFEVVLSGKAHRVGYRINAPNLVSYGGMKAVKIGTDEIVERVSPSRKVRNGVVSEYFLAWRKRYILTVPDPDEPISAKNPAEPQSDKYETDVPSQFKHVKA